MKTVWIIDDDEIYQKIIKHIIDRSEFFERAEYYLCAGHAIEQLEQREEMPDLILVDINMPIIDGWQFLDHLRTNIKEKLKSTKIYIVSSSIAYVDKKRAQEYEEVSGFISKPMSVAGLKLIEEEIKKSV